MNQDQIVSTIIQTINTIFGNIFSSIDNTIFDNLDNIVFINKDILNSTFINKLLDAGSKNSFIYLADAFLLGISVFYIIRYYYFNIIDAKVEKPTQFFFKLLLFSLLINFSYFLAEQILNIAYLFSSSVQEIGKNIIHKDINFSELISYLNEILEINSGELNLFSFDGLLKSFVSIGFVNLLLTYSLRFVIIQVMILFSPFSILTLINSSTSWIFKSWIRTLISLLLIQVVIPVILIVIFCIDESNKILLVGGIYALSRVNSYIKEIFGGISIDVSNNLGSVVSVLKK